MFLEICIFRSKEGEGCSSCQYGSDGPDGTRPDGSDGSEWGPDWVGTDGARRADDPDGRSRADIGTGSDGRATTDGTADHASRAAEPDGAGSDGPDANGATGGLCLYAGLCHAAAKSRYEVQTIHNYV